MFGVAKLKGYVDLRFWEEADLAHFYETEDKISLIQEEWVRGLGFAAGSTPYEEQISENEYALIYLNGEIVDKMRRKNGELIPLKYNRVYSTHLGKMSPRNAQQEFGFDMLQDPDTHIKLITGRFGSGKSVLMIAHALTAIEKNKFEKIVYVRNNIELKDTTPLGALPGTLDEKMINWAANVGDHVGGMDGLKMLIQDRKFEIAPLGYIRGRDLRNCIIFCDEAENLTTAQIQLLIGRIGEGSQLWLAGDRKQTDKAIFDKDSGIGRMMERLRGKPLYAYVNLEKCERSAASAYADYLD